MIREFSDSVEVSIAGDLNAHEYEIANSKLRLRAADIDAVTMGLASIADDKSNNLASKVDVLGCVFDVI